MKKTDLQGLSYQRKTGNNGNEREYLSRNRGDTGRKEKKKNQNPQKGSKNDQKRQKIGLGGFYTFGHKKSLENLQVISAEKEVSDPIARV